MSYTPEINELRTRIRAILRDQAQQAQSVIQIVDNLALLQQSVFNLAVRVGNLENASRTRNDKESEGGQE